MQKEIRNLVLSTLPPNPPPPRGSRCVFAVTRVSIGRCGVTLLCILPLVSHR